MADQTPPPARQMSLIPYAQDAQEVVLRRGNAVVVYDRQSHQLSVRQAADEPVELTDCPYCHRPLPGREPSVDDDESHAGGTTHQPFIHRRYFAMVAASRSGSPDRSGRSTPIRRIVPHALRSGRSRDVSMSEPLPLDAEFVASQPVSTGGNGLSDSSFTEGYLDRNFTEIRELGRGGNGVVLLVEHLIEGVPLGRYACKRIPVGDSKEHFNKVIVEVNLLQGISHPNLVPIHFVWLEHHQSSTFTPRVPHLFILQGFCNGGDLQGHVLGPDSGAMTTEKLKERIRRHSKGNVSPPHDLRGSSKLTFDDIFSYFKDITSGLHHLHSKGYIHRDLKPSNCLLHHDSGRARVLISDFGEVQSLEAVRGSSGATGTISYCAPEVLSRKSDGAFGNFTTKSDIFSLGMIVYFMCFGRLPYLNADGISEDDEDLDTLRAEITSWAGFNDSTRARGDLPERLYKYLKRLLSLDPNERPGTAEILASIQGGVAFSDSDTPYEERSPRLSSAHPSGSKTASRAGGKHPVRPGFKSPRTNSGENVPRARSPGKAERPRSRPTSPQETSSLALSTRKIDLPPTNKDLPPPQQSPQLMLPPPPRRLVVETAVRVTQDSRVQITARVGLFLAKLVSLSLPCAPFAPNVWVAYPLMALAAVELGVLRVGVRQALMLLCVHVMAGMVMQQRGRLCEGRGFAVRASV